jgi:hypothetical protein
MSLTGLVDRRGHKKIEDRHAEMAESFGRLVG